MILITQFWNFENPKRKEEIYECLLKNARNRYISKIYVFSENNSYIKFPHNKIVPLKADHRLTYFEFFKTVNQSFRNQICIVANADVYFDESIVKLNQFDFKNRIIALSSYDSETKHLEEYAIDSWILKSTNIPYSEYEIGKSHDDLRLIRNLRDNGIEILNPSKEVMSYHVDKTKNLKYIPTEALDYVIPSSLKDDVVIEEVEVKEEIKRVIHKSNKKPEYKPHIKSKDINREIKPVLVNRPVKNLKIAVILHLYYQDLWEEFSTMIKNLKGYDYDVYVTLTKGSATIGQTRWVKEKIENEHKNAKVFEIDNKGLDVGAFLVVLEHLSANNIDYDYILKMHSKKSVKTAGVEFGSNWRKQLYRPLIGDANKVNGILSKMENNNNIGMVGNTKWISDYEGLNKGNINDLKRILGIKTTNRKFIGGTMFWVKYPIIKNHFNLYAIRKIITMLEEGYFTDYEKGTYTHALERILGYMVSDSNKLISGV